MTVVRLGAWCDYVTAERREVVVTFRVVVAVQSVSSIPYWAEA